MAHWILVVFLSPLLLLQGLYVKLRTPRLPEAEGQRTGSAGKGDNWRKLMIIGDSAAAGVGVDNQTQALSGCIVKHLNKDHSINWQLEAWSGCTSAEMLQHLEKMENCQADIIVTSLGVNDLITGVTLIDWIETQQNLISLVRTKFKTKMIVVSALPEMKKFPALPQPLRMIIGRRAENFNKSLKKYVAAQNDCYFLHLDIADTPALMASDGFHPGAGAYELWGRAVATAIDLNKEVVIEQVEGADSLLVYSN